MEILKYFGNIEILNDGNIEILGWRFGNIERLKYCMRGLKAQKHLAQGNALGLPCVITARPERAKAFR